MIQHSRVKLGTRFSEGARLAWKAMAERDLEPAAFRRQLRRAPGSTPNAVTPSRFYRLLYGDSPIDAWFGEQFRQLLGVPVEAWFQDPTEPFIPPALAAAEEARAAEETPDLPVL